MAISRFLARQFNLAGKTNMDQARVDQVTDSVLDMCEPYYKYFFESDETKKAEAKRKLLEETVPSFSKRFEMFLGENGKDAKYFVGESLTMADLAVYEGYTSYIQMDKD